MKGKLLSKMIFRGGHDSRAIGHRVHLFRQCTKNKSTNGIILTKHQLNTSRGTERPQRTGKTPKCTWSNGQISPWSREWSRAKANRVMPKEGTGHNKHLLPITQEKTLHMDITRWSIPKSDWLYSLQPKMEKLYTVSKNKTRSWLWLRPWTPYCQIQT